MGRVALGQFYGPGHVYDDRVIKHGVPMPSMLQQLRDYFDSLEYRAYSLGRTASADLQRDKHDAATDPLDD